MKICDEKTMVIKKKKDKNPQEKFRFVEKLIAISLQLFFKYMCLF